mmetsp:Transcript_54787/g.90792  ORF Transcript_54787/g.90792 Transcript_54787/m.90792 type:complete len:370 (+) Transcript_54787:3-1112(+)
MFSAAGRFVLRFYSVFFSLALQHSPPSSLTCGALDHARLLAAPDRLSSGTENGEFEDAEWWERHGDLLAAARREWGQRHPTLYELEANEDRYLNPRIIEAVRAVEAAAAEGRAVDEAPLRALFSPAGAPGVWRFPLFTQSFCNDLLEEIQAAEESGVPLRRPNGMNRFGAILEEVPGGLGFEKSLAFLSRRFLRPLSQMLFPHLVAIGDADDHYGFVVRYRVGEDVSLAGHADASVATLNVNLGIEGFVGGALEFRGTRFIEDNPQDKPPSQVDFAHFHPGEAILHLGGQHHAALPLLSGERVNLVIWLFGEHGTVRVAPYSEREQLKAEQRWGNSTSTPPHPQDHPFHASGASAVWDAGLTREDLEHV